jgi:formyl-CoA transferase
LKLTLSSPLNVHDMSKVTARRAPGIGEHNDEVLKPLGFTGDKISAPCEPEVASRRLRPWQLQSYDPK